MARGEQTECPVQRVYSEIEENTRTIVDESSKIFSIADKDAVKHRLLRVRQRYFANYDHFQRDMKEDLFRMIETAQGIYDAELYFAEQRGRN